MTLAIGCYDKHQFEQINKYCQLKLMINEHTFDGSCHILMRILSFVILKDPSNYNSGLNNGFAIHSALGPFFQIMMLNKCNPFVK